MVIKEKTFTRSEVYFRYYKHLLELIKSKHAREDYDPLFEEYPDTQIFYKIYKDESYGMIAYQLENEDSKDNYKKPSKCHISFIFSSHKNKGIGTKTLKHFMKDIIKKKKIKRIYCDIVEKNKGSIALFSKFGFEKSSINYRLEL